MRTVASISLFLAVVGFTSSQTIDPNSVPLSTRDSWCNDQTTSCPLLCLQQSNSASTRSNTCDPTSLDWTCVCANGQTPSVANYSQTVPYYECTEWANQCVAGCGQDNSCSSNCRQEHPCGAQNPTRVNSSTISSTMSKTASGTSSGSSATATGDTFGGAGSGGSSSSGSSSSSSSSSKSGAQQVAAFGQTAGFGLLFAAVFAGFGMML